MSLIAGDLAPANPSMSATLSEWRAHWRIGALGLFGAAASFGVWINISSLFVTPLEREFGWTRGQIALGQNTTLIGAMLAPFLGRLVDRIGVRRVLLGCVALTAAFFVSLSLVDGSLALYYTLLAAAGIVGLGTTGLTYARVVCSVFVHSRGLALAVMRVGLAVGGALMPLAVQSAIHAAGWRAGFATFGLVMALVALPLVWFWVPRERPVAQNASASAGPGWRSLLRSPKVVLLCLALMLAYMPLFAIFTQLQPLLVEKGVEATQAGRMLALVGIAALFGAAVAGVLLDRLWAPLVGLIFTLLPSMGLFLLLSPELSTAGAACAVLLLGFGYGAESDLLGYMIARYFGMSRYSSIFGLCLLAISIGAAIGVSLMGVTHDRHGRYDPAIWAGVLLSAAASACYLGMGRYPVNPES